MIILFSPRHTSIGLALKEDIGCSECLTEFGTTDRLPPILVSQTYPNGWGEFWFVKG
jgi:hypothetical protein